MSRNYIQEGEVLNHVAAAAIISGAVVLIGKRIGVAVADIASGEIGALAVEGVFALPKVAANAPAQGALLYWDNTAKLITTTAAGNTLAGYAAAPAVNGDATVQININH